MKRDAFSLPLAWSIAAWYFAYFAFVGLFVPFFPVYLKDVGLTVTQIGSVVAAGQAMRIAIPALWGWASDRVGRRVPLIRGSAWLSVAMFLAYFQTDSYLGLTLVTGLLYAAWSGAHPLVEAVTFAYLASASTHYGRIRLWGSVGFVVAVLGGGWWLDGRAIAQLLWLALGSLLLVLLVARCLREPQSLTDSAATSSPLTPAVATSSPSLRKENASAEGGSLNRQALAVLLAAALMSIAHGPLYAFLSLYLEQLGYSRSAIGWLWALGVSAEIAVFLWQPLWARRWSSRQVLFACFVLAALRFYLLADYAALLGMVLAAQLLHGATFGAHHVATVSALNQWFPARMQGRIQALYGSFSFGAGGMLGAWLGGWLWQAYGASVTFLFAAACSLGGLLAIRLGLPAQLGRVG